MTYEEVLEKVIAEREIEDRRMIGREPEWADFSCTLFSSEHVGRWVRGQLGTIGQIVSISDDRLSCRVERDHYGPLNNVIPNQILQIEVGADMSDSLTNLRRRHNIVLNSLQCSTILTLTASEIDALKEELKELEEKIRINQAQHANTPISTPPPATHWVDVKLDKFEDYHVGRKVRISTGSEFTVASISTIGNSANSTHNDVIFASSVTQIEQRPDPFKTTTTTSSRQSLVRDFYKGASDYAKRFSNAYHDIEYYDGALAPCTDHTPIPLGSKSGFCKTCDCDMILNADLQWVRK